MESRTDWQMFEDVKRVMEFKSPVVLGDPCAFGANVGEAMAVAMAAAGAYAFCVGGATPCETDYLAAAGATFPADVTREELEEFNRLTMSDDMDEADEHARYAAIALFFRRMSA